MKKLLLFGLLLLHNLAHQPSLQAAAAEPAVKETKASDNQKLWLQGHIDSIRNYLIQKHGVSTDEPTGFRKLKDIQGKNQRELQASFKKILDYSQANTTPNKIFWETKLVTLTLLNKFDAYDFILNTLKQHTNEIDQTVLQTLFHSILLHILPDSVQLDKHAPAKKNPFYLKYYSEIKTTVQVLITKGLPKFFIRACLLHTTLAFMNEKHPFIDSLAFLGLGYTFDNLEAKNDKLFLADMHDIAPLITQKLLIQLRDYRDNHIDFLVRDAKDTNNLLTTGQALAFGVLPHSYLLKKQTRDTGIMIKMLLSAQYTSLTSFLRRKKSNSEVKETPQEDQPVVHAQELTPRERMLQHALMMLTKHCPKPEGSVKNAAQLQQIGNKTEQQLKTIFHKILTYTSPDMECPDKFFEVQIVSLALMQTFKAYNFISTTIQNAHQAIDTSVLQALVLSIYYHATHQTIDPITTKPIPATNDAHMVLSDYKTIENLLELLIKQGAEKEFVQTLFFCCSLISLDKNYDETGVTKNPGFLALAQKFDFNNPAEEKTFIDHLQADDTAREPDIFEAVRSHRKAILEQSDDETLRHLFEQISLEETKEARSVAEDALQQAQQQELLKAQQASEQHQKTENHQKEQAALAKEERKKQRAEQTAQKHQASEMTAKKELATQKEKEAERAANVLKKQHERAQRKAAATEAAEKKRTAEQLHTVERFIDSVFNEVREKKKPTITAHESVATLIEEFEKLELNEDVKEAAVDGDEQLTREEQAAKLASDENFKRSIQKVMLGIAASRGSETFIAAFQKKLAHRQTLSLPLAQNSLENIFNEPLDERGNRVLHLAFMHGKLSFATALLTCVSSIDYSIPNNDGQTAPEILLELLKKNSKIFPNFSVEIKEKTVLNRQLLKQMITDEWITHSYVQGVHSAITLIEKFSQESITLHAEPRWPKMHSIFDILERFLGNKRHHPE